MPTIQPTKKKKTPAAQPDAKELKQLATLLTSAEINQRQAALEVVLRFGQRGEHQALADRLIPLLWTGIRPRSNAASSWPW